MEAVVTVVILGILASVSIPSFQGMMSESRRRDATTNLLLLYTAQRVHFNDNGAYVEAGDIATLNADLNIGIIPGQVEYSCDATHCYANGTGVNLSIDFTAATPQVN